MNTAELNSFIVTLIYGAPILLSLLKITNPINVNKKANFWFGIFLFIWSTFWLDDISAFFSKAELNVTVAVLLQFIQFFTPLIFYLSVLFFTNPDFHFHLKDFKYLVIPLLFLIMSVVIAMNDREIPFLRKLSIGLILLHEGVKFFCKRQFRLIKRNIPGLMPCYFCIRN